MGKIRCSARFRRSFSGRVQASLERGGQLARAGRIHAGFQTSLGWLADFLSLARLGLEGVGSLRRAIHQFQLGRGRSARRIARFQADAVSASCSGLIHSPAVELRFLVFQFFFRSCHDLFPPCS